MSPFPTRRLVLASALALAAAPARGQPAPLTVFAAASLKNVLDEVGTAFAATGRPAPRYSYAASSAIARQIEQGAPADVFLSADSEWMDYLAARRLVDPATRRDLLTNRLALIAPAASRVRLPIRRGMPLAAALGDGRLAVAGPDVPAGRYARAALAHLGVLGEMEGRLAPAENVRTALAFVARRETPLGIVYDTDARVEPKVRIVGLFPIGSHPQITYPMARVAASRNADALAYMRFLKGSRAAALFLRHGFSLLPGARL